MIERRDERLKCMQAETKAEAKALRSIVFAQDRGMLV